MLRGMTIFMIALSMMISSSCATKKKAEEDPSAEQMFESVPEAAPILPSFPELGSDSGDIIGLRSITFDYDQARLSSTARQILADNASWIQSQNVVLVQVEGHCDNRGSSEYNLALGDRRAEAVKDYLVSLGVDPLKLSTLSYGKEKPLRTENSEEAHRANRRANFVPISE